MSFYEHSVINLLLIIFIPLLHSPILGVCIIREIIRGIVTNLTHAIDAAAAE